MLALCLMLLGTYYAQNYASIIGGCLASADTLQYVTLIEQSCKAAKFSVLTFQAYKHIFWLQSSDIDMA